MIRVTGAKPLRTSHRSILAAEPVGRNRRTRKFHIELRQSCKDMRGENRASSWIAKSATRFEGFNYIIGAVQERLHGGPGKLTGPPCPSCLLINTSETAERRLGIHNKSARRKAAFPPSRRRDERLNLLRRPGQHTQKLPCIQPLSVPGPGLSQ